MSTESPIAGRSVIDIKATANKHRDIADNLPGLHALTGCDSTSYIYIYIYIYISALKVLVRGKYLKLLGELDVGKDDMLADLSYIFYGNTKDVASKCGGDLSKPRYNVWSSKMAKSKISCVFLHIEITTAHFACNYGA